MHEPPKAWWQRSWGMSSERLRGGTWGGRVHGGWQQASYGDGMPGVQSQACDVCDSQELSVP